MHEGNRRPILSTADVGPPAWRGQADTALAGAPLVRQTAGPSRVITKVSVWRQRTRIREQKNSKTSRLQESHESNLPFVSRIEFIRSKLPNFSAHVSGVSGAGRPPFAVMVHSGRAGGWGGDVYGAC